MGAWGTAIFSDDLAEDVRDEYNALLSIGKSNEEAENLLLSYYSDILDKGDEDEPVFWFALALSEWNKGRLSDLVKIKVLEILDNGGDLRRWNTPGNEKNYKKRIKVIQDFRKTILSKQPAEKKMKKPTVHHCPWRVGDLLAYRIVTNKDVKNGPLSNMWEMYALLRVIQIDKHPVSNLVPTEVYNETMLVGLYGWVGDEIPEPNIVENLEYIPITDYVPPPPPGVINLSPLENLPEESKEKVLTALKNTFSTERRIETCAQLNWIPYKDRKGDITFLAHDSAYEETVPEYFKTNICEYALTHFLPFDYSLAKRLQSYFNL